MRGKAPLQTVSLLQFYCEQLCNFDTFLDHLFRVRKMEKKAQSDFFLPIFHPADSYALGNDLVLS